MPASIGPSSSLRGVRLRFTTMLAIASLPLFAACSGELTAPAPEVNQTAASVTDVPVIAALSYSQFSLPPAPDAFNNAVAFLAPLGSSSSTAGFDATLLNQLRVQVCQSATCENSVLAAYTSAGSGPEQLKLDVSGRNYQVAWSPARTVAVGSRVFVSIDVMGQQITALPTTTPNGALVIRFRVYNNPSIRVRQMRAAGASAIQIATAVRAAFNVGDQAMARLLFADRQPFTTEEVAEMLRRVYGTSLNTAASYFGEFGVPADQAASGLRVGYGLTDGDGAEKLGGAMKGANYSAPEVATNVKSLFGLTNEQTALLLKTIDYAPEEVADAIKLGLELGDEAAAGLFKAIGYDAFTTFDLLKLKYANSFTKAGLVMRLAGYAADELAAVIEDSGIPMGKELAIALRAMGFAANEYGDVLVRIGGLKSEAAMKILNEMGVSPSDVASWAKTGLAMTPEAAAAAMKFAGYTATEIAGGLKTAYNATASTVVNALKAAGYTATEVGAVLRTVFNLSVSQTGDLLKTAYGLGASALNSVLGGAGYAASEVGDWLDDVFGDWLDDIDDFFDDLFLKTAPTASPKSAGDSGSTGRSTSVTKVGGKVVLK